MKKFILALCVLSIISCQKDDSTSDSGSTEENLNFVIEKIEPMHENSNVVKEYRFDENNRVISMFHENNEDSPWYTYNYSTEGALTSIDYSWGFIQVDQVNYKGRLDIELLDDKLFRGKLNIYDEDNTYVDTLEEYEIVFDGQLIKRISRYIVEIDHQITKIYEHDLDGRLLATKDIINENPIRDNWKFTAWIEEPTPLFDVLTYTLDMNWFPDKFISLYGVTQGAFRDDDTSTFSYEIQGSNNDEYRIDWTGPYPIKEYKVTYKVF